MREPACTDVTDAHAIEESSTIKIAGVKILLRGGSTRLRLFISRPFFAVWSEILMTQSRVYDTENHRRVTREATRDPVFAGS